MYNFQIFKPSNLPSKEITVVKAVSAFHCVRDKPNSKNQRPSITIKKFKATGNVQDIAC